MASPWDQNLHLDAKRRAARHSIFAGAFLTVLKLVAAIATGSLGLLAEAAHSALDLGAAVVTWVAVRTSWRPPDAEHQYGHGKIENLAALAETGLLVVTALWIVREAAERLAGPAHLVRSPAIAIAVMVVSIVVDLVRARDLRRVAIASKSQALEADALHFSSDVLSSAVVVLGLAGAWVARRGGPGWLAMADPVAAIAVALFVLVLSWRLGRRAVDMLLDRAPAGMARAIEGSLATLADVVAPPRVRVRQAGDVLFADVELPVRPGVPVAQGDRIAADARERVKAITGDRASVLVQLRPVTDETAGVRLRIDEAVAMEGAKIHDVTLRRVEGATHVDLHLELPGNMSLADGHRVADRVEARILERVPAISRVDIHLEHDDAEPEAAFDVEPEVREALERRIDEIARREVGPNRLHDLLLRRTSAGLYLSCHCLFPASTPLAEAHDATDRLEAALRAAIPELRRVAVHAEPEGIHG